MGRGHHDAVRTRRSVRAAGGSGTIPRQGRFGSGCLQSRQQLERTAAAAVIGVLGWRTRRRRWREGTPREHLGDPFLDPERSADAAVEQEICRGFSAERVASAGHVTLVFEPVLWQGGRSPPRDRTDETLRGSPDDAADRVREHRGRGGVPIAVPHRVPRHRRRGARRRGRPRLQPLLRREARSLVTLGAARAASRRGEPCTTAGRRGPDRAGPPRPQSAPPSSNW